jgi:class 3 adenylate cyclase/tetratricopeptide (TPR) repeat protein
VIVCATCGAENRDGARFCDSCGAPLAAAERPREERKTVTVLFCDVLGSTARAERLDPETTRATMARYFDTARAAIERHGGTVEKFIGDAVMAVFGVPQVHEDDALRAVRAALELRDAVEIEVRIGVNTGRVVTGSGDTLVTGDAVNVAARLEQAAAPGEVLIGAATYGLVRNAVDVELLPPLEAKGKSEPLTAYRLVALTGSEARVRRLDAPLVGRTRETRLLADAWDRVRSERACALFTILGAAGVGKSRLVREFLGTVDGTVVSARCLSYGEGITYWPVVEIVKQLLGEAAPDDPGIAAVLGEGQATTEDIAFSVRKLLEAAAGRRPLVVLLDDVHWGEPAFLDLVEHTADWSRDAPILLLCLGRPELLDRRPGWSGGKLNATTVLLEPLAADETRELIDTLLGDDDDLAPGLRARILDAAEGNPLFVEEMLAMVREGGGDVSVPGTIQALLAARIDQLPRSEREALERGAVEGQVFHRGAVQALAPDEPAVATHLMGLVRKELVRPSTSVFPADDAFRFRHLLIRDAAYEALPKTARAELHERFADWVGQVGAGLVELDELLGYHLEQAARYRAELGTAAPELARRAGSHLGSSGIRALQRTDLYAAANLLRRATDLLELDDPTRPRLLSGLGEAVYGMGDVELGRTLLAQAARDADTAGDAETAANARLMATFIRGHMGEESLAHFLEELDEVIASLPPSVSDEVVARAYSGRGWCKFWLGRCSDALDDALHALDVAAGARSSSLEDEIAGLVTAAMLMGPTPWPDLERFVDERLAKGSGHQGGRGGSDMRNHRPLADAARGDFEAARAAFGGLRRARLEQGATMYDHSVASSVAEVEVLAGDFTAAERILEEAWIGLAAAGERGFRSTVGALLANVLVRLGRLDDAARVVHEAEGLTAEDDMYTLVTARRARALLASARGEHAEAQAHAAEAVRLADGTDYVEQQAENYLALAEVLIASDRSAAAAEPLRAAIELAEAKGSTVLAGRARAQLDSLTAPA